MSFKKATKLKSKLRLGLCGLAGTGKTYSALSIASALAKFIREGSHGPGKIAVIDSEKGSASLYADRFDFDVCELDSFSPLTYVDKIHEAEQAGYDFIIIDSLSHAWTGKDGALDQKDQAAARGGNSWTAWRDITPKHNALVDAMVGSSAHVIATLRTKMEYVQETTNGKVEIKKVGLAAIQREGLEYEVGILGEIGYDHTLKISKTRCAAIGIGDQYEKPGENFARKLYDWLMSGAELPARVAAPAVAMTPAAPAASSSAFEEYLEAVRASRDLAELDARVSGPGRPARGTADYNRAGEVYAARKADLQKQTEAA